MRIITGSAKGIKLKTLKGLYVRPTADRVKESVFNILENIDINRFLGMDMPCQQGCIYQAKVLDLFAGTGNLGLEALSRGAKHAVFVDKSPASLAVIRENIQTAQMGHLCEVIKSDVFSALTKMKKEGRSFNLVFADPPYDQGLAARTADIFDGVGLLAPGGVLLLEHSKSETIGHARQNLDLIRSQQYGRTIFSLLINLT